MTSDMGRDEASDVARTINFLSPGANARAQQTNDGWVVSLGGEGTDGQPARDLIGSQAVREYLRGLKEPATP